MLSKFEKLSSQPDMKSNRILSLTKKLSLRLDTLLTLVVNPNSR